MHFLVSKILTLKDTVSGVRQFLETDSPFKMIKSTFRPQDI